MNTFWNEKVEKPNFSILDGDMSTDILIVGGGIAGILCAHFLKSKGVDCMLVEADKICSGTTRNTTGKITVQHGLIYDKLIKKFGLEGAKLYLEAQTSACEEYARLCSGISCDYEKRDSFVYSLNNREKIEKELCALERIGQGAEFSLADALPFKTVGAVCIRGQAQFNPLRFLYSIAKKLPIYEQTKVTELMPGKAKTARGIIAYKKMIIATHFPILNKHGGYFLKMYQHRSYVLALSGAGDVQGMYIDESKKGLSFRNYNNQLLLGGGSHRTGKHGGGWNDLESAAKKYYADAKIINRWATQDCITLDGAPYIGLYSKSTPNVYVATGFNKWGMSSSMLSAMILTDLILEKENRYVELFSPGRSMLSLQLAVNTFESLVNLLKPTVPRCPHLGCALKYNKEEHSWDCPCHGSRFTESGKLINGPATDGKNFRA
jgi:glycine/D-amino acid oxidase-like deaminating enzyme